MKINIAKLKDILSMQSDVTLRSTATISVMEAFNTGRELAGQANADQIATIQSSALLDKATCDYCRAKDGETLPYDRVSESDAPPYPQCGEGYGKCRCLWIYTFKTEGGQANA